MSEERRYPALSEDMQARGLGAMLRIFGPGAIIASVTIGSGETVFASRGGAVFGYALLWCFIGGGLMKFVQVYTAARYMTLTGEHPLERWEFFPGPQGWAVWTDRRFLPASLRMGWPLRVLNLVSGVFLTGWGLRSAFDFFAG